MTIKNSIDDVCFFKVTVLNSASIRHFQELTLCLIDDMDFQKGSPYVLNL